MRKKTPNRINKETRRAEEGKLLGWRGHSGLSNLAEGLEPQQTNGVIFLAHVIGENTHNGKCEIIIIIMPLENEQKNCNEIFESATQLP